MGIFDGPDRKWKNNNSDGKEFYGYDDGNGKTTWVDSDGNLDSISDTPSDWEQDMNNEGY